VRTLIERAVSAHLPGRTIVEVRDRGVRVRHIRRVTLDGDEVALVKISEHTSGR
jgi:hypothetical protein